MSLLSVSGHSVFAATITLPLFGVWTADLDIDASVDLSGAATIEIAEGESLVGTVVSGELQHGYMHARIVGGAAGLSKLAAPKHYTAPKLRTVLSDLLATAGETLSSALAADVLNAPLLAWTTMEMPIGAQIAALVGSTLPGASWRILADGTLWVGAETWPESDVPEWRVIDRRPADGSIELGLDSPALLPGTLLGDDRIGPVQYVIGQRGVRATAWLA